MSTILPTARMGVILSSGNQWVEPYFRAYSPASLGVCVTRMRMGSGGGITAENITNEAVHCAGLLADAEVDVIDLQATGLMMELGPDGEAGVVDAITGATGIAAFTATQAVVEALRALAIEKIIVINPMDEAALAREQAYLEKCGFTIAHGTALGLGEAAGSVTGAAWAEAAAAHDRPDGDGFFLSSSFTTMLEAVAPIERKLGKPAVTSIQAALWAGMRRLAPKLDKTTPPPELGRLFETA